MSKIVINVENDEIKDKVVGFLSSFDKDKVSFEIKSGISENYLKQNAKEILLNSLGETDKSWKSEYGEYLSRKHS